jgi:dihydrodipicolinate synthase/N-acetylneuraminate lyase
VVTDQAKGRVPIILGTGDISMRIIIELTGYVKDAGRTW